MGNDIYDCRGDRQVALFQNAGRPTCRPYVKRLTTTSAFPYDSVRIMTDDIFYEIREIVHGIRIGLSDIARMTTSGT